MDAPSRTNAGFRTSRHRVDPHDHAVFVYDDIEDILMPIEHFIREGARERDLSAFVHSFRDNDEARAFLSSGMPDVTKHEADGDFSAAPYPEAFERDGRIDYDHVGGVITMLSSTATATGRRAPRIFVDASKNYFDAGRADDWFAFERWLGPRLQAKVGLVCAYRASDLQDPDILRQVLETHQYRFDGQRGAPRWRR